MILLLVFTTVAIIRFKNETKLHECTFVWCLVLLMISCLPILLIHNNNIIKNLFIYPGCLALIVSSL